MLYLGWDSDPGVHPGLWKMMTSTKMSTKQNDSGDMIGYEAEMWAMAPALRGSMDPTESMHIVLGGHVCRFGGWP